MVSKIFYFHPYLGKWSNLTNIFQMGWNHQRASYFLDEIPTEVSPFMQQYVKLQYLVCFLCHVSMGHVSNVSPKTVFRTTKKGTKTTLRLCELLVWNFFTKPPALLLMVQKSKKPPGMVLKPVVNHGIFTISTGDRRISEPSTEIMVGAYSTYIWFMLMI